MLVYTDGRVMPSGEGRAGFIILKGKKIVIERVFSKSEKTNPNRMELSSVIATLKFLRTINETNEHIKFYVDSIYVVNGVENLDNWIETGEINEIVEKDLWMLYKKESEGLSLSFQWIKGHEKENKSTIHHKMNKRVDRNLREL